jgi:hypothetical protein
MCIIWFMNWNLESLICSSSCCIWVDNKLKVCEIVVTIRIVQDAQRDPISQYLLCLSSSSSYVFHISSVKQTSDCHQCHDSKGLKAHFSKDKKTWHFKLCSWENYFLPMAKNEKIRLKIQKRKVAKFPYWVQVVLGSQKYRRMLNFILSYLIYSQQYLAKSSYSWWPLWLYIKKFTPQKKTHWRRNNSFQ